LRKVGAVAIAVLVFSVLHLVWDAFASRSHPAALAAIHGDKVVGAELGSVRWAMPIGMSYRAETPPYRDCEYRDYVVWSDQGLAFLGVSLRRRNMYRDPWEVYAITTGYSNLTRAASSGCKSAFEAPARTPEPSQVERVEPRT
jgi:hypothetical protein